VGCKRVARLMRRAGIKGVYPKSFVITTIPGVTAASLQRSGGSTVQGAGARSLVGGRYNLPYA